MVYDQLKKAIRTLACMCDGAKKNDALGFNKFDSPDGHMLAEKENWTFKDAQYAYHMIQKYSKQVKIDGILEPVREYNMIEIEDFPWSRAKYVSKLNKWVRNTPIPQDFFAYYKRHKEEIKKFGISMTNYDDEWMLAWWTDERPIQKPKDKYQYVAGHYSGAVKGRDLSEEEAFEVERKDKISNMALSEDEFDSEDLA